jgi:hypothetical protein
MFNDFRFSRTFFFEVFKFFVPKESNNHVKSNDKLSVRNISYGSESR